MVLHGMHFSRMKSQVLVVWRKSHERALLGAAEVNMKGWRICLCKEREPPLQLEGKDPLPEYISLSVCYVAPLLRLPLR